MMIIEFHWINNEMISLRPSLFVLEEFELFLNEDGTEVPIHMPADGSAYMLWVNNRHQIVNPTDKPRYHIIMNAWDTKQVTEKFNFPHIEELKKRVEIFNERIASA